MRNYLNKFLSANFLGPKKIKLQSRRVKDFSNISLVIKVMSCMICGSDIRIYKEGSSRIKKPRIIGHETSGIIVYSKNKKFKVGDQVSLGADIEKKT